LKKKIYFICCLVASFVVNAQDIQFSQYLSNPLYLNPALAGSEGCSRASVFYRNQWPKLDGSYLSTGFSYDQYVKSLHGGIGLYYKHDNLAKGIFKYNELNFSYAPHTNIKDKVTIATGFDIGFHQRKIDLAKLNFGDQIDPVRGWIYESQHQQEYDMRIFVDFSIGLAVYGEQFASGISILHLHEPNQSQFVNFAKSPLPRRYAVYGSYKFALDSTKQLAIAPNYVFLMQENSRINIFGVDFMYRELISGLKYRTGNNLVLIAGMATGKFGLSYGYDWDLDDSGRGGAHEVFLTFKGFNCRKGIAN